MKQPFIAYLTVRDPRAAIEFYEKALPSASQTMIIDGPHGSVMHAEMTVNGQIGTAQRLTSSSQLSSMRICQRWLSAG